MATYLKFNGVSDKLTTPALTWDKVVFDVYVDSTISAANLRYLLQPVSGTSLLIRLAANATTFTQFNASMTGAVVNQRTILTAISTLTPASATTSNRIFARADGTSGFMGGNLYRLTFYNAGVVVADYDMSTGTVQDVSGNGNHATLTGGTWLDDGTGGGTADATITGIIANASADTLAPTVSTVSSVSTSINAITATVTADTLNPSVSTYNTVTSIIAGASADAPNPSISLSGNINVITVVADMTADALAPQVGSFTNISVNAVIVSANADGISPSVDTVRNISIDTLIADATSDAMAAMVGSSASVQITAVMASVTSDGIAPSVGTSQGTRIDTVTAELMIDAVSPAIQTDAIISAFIADVIATGMSPIINKDAIPTYNEVIQIVLNITRKQTAPLDITQRVQSELKL